jgi:hypothetical protein
VLGSPSSTIAPPTRASRSAKQAGVTFRSTCSGSAQRDSYEHTAPDRETPAERAEQSVFGAGQRLIEELDNDNLSEFNAAAERDYGFDRGSWNRRIG